MKCYYHINVSFEQLIDMEKNKKVAIKEIIIDQNKERNVLGLKEFIELINILMYTNFVTEIKNDNSINITILSDEFLPKLKWGSNSPLWNVLSLINPFEYSLSYTQKDQFRCLIHIIKLCELDRVVFVDRTNMLKYKFVEFYQNVRKINIFENFRKKDVYMEYPVYKVHELMGCYIDVRDNEDEYNKYFNDIGEPLNINENNVICLCLENISEVFDTLKDKNSIFIDENTFKNIVFTHELGHLVFSYIKCSNRELEEKQANYFSSLSLKGECDFEIKSITNIQPMEYHHPILISSRMRNVSKYEEQVNGLYEGKLVK